MNRTPELAGEAPAPSVDEEAEQRPALLEESVMPASGSFLNGLWRGLRRRCPNCGKGGLFDGYLRVRPTCDACGADNDRYPADDAPPYFTILLVGHLVVAPMLVLEVIRTWPLWLSVSLACTLVLACTLAFLPFIKGGVVGACWALDIVRDPRDRAA